MTLELSGKIRRAIRRLAWGEPHTTMSRSSTRSEVDVERGQPDERTGLLSRENGTSNGNALFKHSRIRHTLHTIEVILRSNPLNWLLGFVVLGIVAGALEWSPTAIFVLNFLAIVPLAALMGFATEELADEAGDTVGGLMNATFGNAVEMIVSIVALIKGEIRIVQASMLGSILSNILLVLGMAFLFGGIGHKEQTFNATVASTMSSLMAVATSSLIIPAALYATLERSDSPPHFEQILRLSRGTSIVLLGLYILFLWFQLSTHKYIFDSVTEPAPGPASITNGSAAEENGSAENSNDVENADDAARFKEPQEPEPKLGMAVSIALLLVVTVLVSICAEYLVGSIEGIVESSGISKTFIGLILIPIVGNAAEHATAVVAAVRNKMDLAIHVAIGSSMQIALFVTPCTVLIGWAIGQPMSLYFQTFETVVFFVSTYLTYYVIQDGKSNYLEGAMLLGIYIIIAISFFVYPDSANIPGVPSL